MRFVPEAVASLARATARAERRLESRRGEARPWRASPAAVERQLLTVIDLPKYLRHVSVPPTDDSTQGV